MNLPRQLAATLALNAGDALHEIGLILRPDTTRNDHPAGRFDEDTCACGEDHQPGSAVDLLRHLAERNTRRTGQPKPEPGPSTIGREWSAVFADKIRAGDLVAVDGPQLGRDDLGLRALRVKEIRRREHQGILGSAVSAIVLLLQDEDSGEPATATVSVDSPLRVAALAPDSVPADLGGEA